MIHLCSSEAKAFLMLVVSLTFYYLVKESVPSCEWSLLFFCCVGLLSRWIARGSSVVLPVQLRTLNGLSRPVALVTGASSGVGFAVTMALVLSGWNVVAAGRNLQHLLTARKKIHSKRHRRGNGGEIFVLDVLDVSDEVSIRQFVAKLEESEGSLPISLLVNAAGILKREVSYCKETSPWWSVESMLGTNAVGPMLLSLLMLPVLERSAVKTGMPSRIINVASSCHTFLSVFSKSDPISMIAGLSIARAAELSRENQSITCLVKKTSSFSAHYCLRSFNSYNFVNYYGLSKLCTIWNTRIISQFIQQKNNFRGKVMVACVHPGVIITHLYREFLPSWVLDRALYYPSLLCGKSWAESAFSTLRAISCDERDFKEAGYYLCDGDHSHYGSWNCLSEHAQNRAEEQRYGCWLSSLLRYPELSRPSTN